MVLAKTPNPPSPVLAGRVHSTKKGLPSVSGVIQSIEDIKSKRSMYCSELLEALKNLQD